MRRSSRRLLACLCACVTFLLVGVPTASAALAKVDLLDFDRQTGGYGVQVAAAVTCNPPELPNTMTYLSVTLVQGTSPHRSYIEGFGGIVEPNLPPIVCDGTTHEYSFTVVRLDRLRGQKVPARPRHGHLHSDPMHRGDTRQHSMHSHSGRDPRTGEDHPVVGTRRRQKISASLARTREPASGPRTASPLPPLSVLDQRGRGAGSARVLSPSRTHAVYTTFVGWHWRRRSARGRP